jgi:hypothetical protein
MSDMIIKIAGLELQTNSEKFLAMAGENLNQFDLVNLHEDNKYYKSCCTSIDTMPGTAIVMEALQVNTNGEFLRRGIITGNWAFPKNGKFLYAGSTPGIITQNLPTISGHQLEIVGINLTANQIDFQPNLLLIEIA